MDHTQHHGVAPAQRLGMGTVQRSGGALFVPAPVPAPVPRHASWAAAPPDAEPESRARAVPNAVDADWSFVPRPRSGVGAGPGVGAAESLAAGAGAPGRAAPGRGAAPGAGTSPGAPASQGDGQATGAGAGGQLPAAPGAGAAAADRRVWRDELGALAPYAADPAVTDLFVNGAQGLFVDRGRGPVREPGWHAGEAEVRALATALIARGGRHVDEASPCVDVRLADGARVHAVLPPIARHGTSLSIRVPRLGPPSLDALAAGGMFGGDPGVLAWLREVVRARTNLLIAGAAGAGKTTLLAALLAEASTAERIVTIEDVAELQIDHPHHVSLEARQPNIEGAGEVGLARLVREALRMRPDRLVVGECRGAEVRELLSALNTGHAGGAGTVHANGLADVAARLEALGALCGMSDHALARQAVSAIGLVLHVERTDAGHRFAGAGVLEVRGGRLIVTPMPMPMPTPTSMPSPAPTHVRTPTPTQAWRA